MSELIEGSTVHVCPSLWLVDQQAIDKLLGQLRDVLVSVFFAGVRVLVLPGGDVLDGLHVIVTQEGRHARQP